MKFDKVRDCRMAAMNECDGIPESRKVVESVVGAARNVYSQFGEDGIIEAIFDRIGIANKWCFECGAANGLFLSNTRRLIESGWNGILVEQSEPEFKELEQNSPDTININATLVQEGKYAADNIILEAGGDADMDLFSLDIDGQEFYILNSMHAVRPRVIIVEHDPLIENTDFVPQPGGTGQAGAMAIQKMLAAKLYWPICQTFSNTIAIKNEIIHDFLKGKQE